MITGAWGLPEYGTAERLGYLDLQLARYTAACELGYDLTVVLSTYSPWNYTGLAALDPARHVCARTLSGLRVRVAQHAYAPLPPGAEGTGGTLAFQHRTIFLAERHNYDLFICQEDDIAVEPHHLAYFLRWAAFFNGTDMYPGWASYEVAPWESHPGKAAGSGALGGGGSGNGLEWDGGGAEGASSRGSAAPTVGPAQVMVDWRAKHSYLFRHRGASFLAMMAGGLSAGLEGLCEHDPC